MEKEKRIDKEHKNVSGKDNEDEITSPNVDNTAAKARKYGGMCLANSPTSLTLKTGDKSVGVLSGCENQSFKDYRGAYGYYPISTLDLVYIIPKVYNFSSKWKKLSKNCLIVQTTSNSWDFQQ